MKTVNTKVPSIDSINGVKKIDIIIAKVIRNSYSSQVNFLTLDSGSKQGVQPEMGVINSLGIVGVIENVSPKYSTVLSILNTESPINAKIKKPNTTIFRTSCRIAF